VAVPLLIMALSVIQHLRPRQDPDLPG
jgi:hypothetical protein